MKNISKLVLVMILTLSFVSAFALANPASVKCEEDGGTLTIVTDSTWAQSWVCTFSNWVSCDEWAYYRWECSSSWTTTEIKACTKEYMPVCAEVQVQCIMAPCPPLKETFSNKCEMENNSLAVFLHDWVCEADKVVEEEESVMCTMEYAPVCWQPPMPECGEWKACIQMMPAPVTYGNKCMMNAAKATLLNEWECKGMVIDEPEIDESERIKISKETDLVKAYIDLPLVKNKTIDDRIYDYVSDYLDDFLKGVPTEKVSDNWKYEINITWETKKVGIVTTYKLTIYEFTWWAHWNTIIKTFNFKKDWTEIIFKNEKTLKKVANYSLNFFNNLLKKWEISSDEDLLKTWLEAKFENYSNWLITELDKDTLKIIFIFPQYQIAPYSEWIKSVEMDITELK